MYRKSKTQTRNFVESMQKNRTWKNLRFKVFNKLKSRINLQNVYGVKFSIQAFNAKHLNVLRTCI